MKTIQIGKQAYPIEFGTAAMRVIEREWGRQTGDLTNALEHVIRAMVTASAPVGMSVLICYAGIEGGRAKHRTRPVPYTSDEIDALIDESGGVFTFLKLHFPTVSEAFSEDNAIRVFLQKEGIARPPEATAATSRSTGARSRRPRRRSGSTATRST